MTTTSQPRPSRGRRSTRPSGEDREQAILDTAERLLRDRPYADISVDDLAKGAGISRPTFYFYFASKEAVLLALWESVIQEADAALESLPVARADDRHDIWRPAIKVFLDTFGNHQGVTVAASGSDNSAVRSVFAKFMQKWIDFTAQTIEVERRRGAAPITLPAHDIATSLNLMNERTLLAAFAAETPGIPPDRVLDTLVHVWTCAVYGQYPQPSRSR